MYLVNGPCSITKFHMSTGHDKQKTDISLQQNMSLGGLYIETNLQLLYDYLPFIRRTPVIQMRCHGTVYFSPQELERELTY